MIIPANPINKPAKPDDIPELMLQELQRIRLGIQLATDETLAPADAASDA